jgi:ATP-binding cassette subfamily C protein
VLDMGRRWVLLVAGFGLIVTVLNIAMLLLKMYMISSLTELGTWDMLWSSTYLWVAIYVGLAVAGIMQAAAVEHLSRHIADQLTVPALLGVVEYAEMGSAKLHAVLEDLETVRETLAGFAARTLVKIAMTPMLVPLALAIHWMLGAVCIAFCLVMAVLSLALARAARAEQELTGAGAGSAYKLTLDTMRAGEAVLAMGMLPRLAGHWVSVSSEKAGAIWLAHRGLARLKLVNGLVLGLSRGSFMLTMFAITLTGSYMTAFISGASILVLQVFSPFAALGTTMEAFAAATSAWQRLRRLAAATTKPRPNGLAFPCPHGRLAVQRLSFAFHGHQPLLLRNIELTVDPGRCVAILGSSGSGKSTLLRLLLGLHQPTAGGVFLDGHATCHWARRDLARHVGFLPQQPLLARGTVAETIARLEQPEMDLVMEAARRAGAHELIAGLPLGYATPVGGQYQFSMGQRHRIAIARALYGRPKLLLLDEFAASLDAEGEAEMVHLLGQLRREKCSVVFTTHRAALLQCADQVLALRAGTLVPAGQERHPARTVLGERRLA